MTFMTTELTASAPAEILKTDVLGRVRVRKERREEILDQFEKSGMAGRPFAKMIGVNYQTFASWIQKRQKARGDYQRLRRRKKIPALTFAEAVVEPSPKVGLTIELPGGARVKIESAEQMELLCRFLARVDKKDEQRC